MNKPIGPTRRLGITAALAALFLLNLCCAVGAVYWALQQTRLKDDYAHVNSIRNGLFSVEAWKGHLENIVGRSITNLRFSPEEEKALKGELEQVVKALMLQADEVLRNESKSLRKVAYKALVDLPTLMKRSPQFAQAVLDELKKPANLEKLRLLALAQLNRYSDQTRDNQEDPAALPRLLDTYHVKSIDEFNTQALTRLAALKTRIQTATGTMMATLILFGGFWWRRRADPDLQKPLFAYAVALALLVLLTSLSLPMIDIDARIKSVDLTIIGERLQFKDQILFFRSKSILQVVNVLIRSGKLDSMFVGMLLLLFSVIFPISKLVSTLLSLVGHERWRQNKVVHFFAFKSGKWSMADVMVVAIFMSYIGFNGILNDQLKNLHMESDSWQLVATNETSLQPGFILFISFVLFGLALSTVLERIQSRTAA